MKVAKRKSEADSAIEELGQSMMKELTKVVDMVSMDLRVVSEQLKNMSTSMSESMIAINASRDISRSYGGQHADRSYDTSDIVGCDDDMGPAKSAAQMVRHHQRKRSSDKGKSPLRGDKADSRYSPQGSPGNMQSNLISDSDRILTEMIQDGIRNKLLQIMKESSD